MWRVQKPAIHQQFPLRVLIKRSSENMQQIYMRAFVQKYDFNKVSLQLYLSHFSPYMFFCRFTVYFQNTFSLRNIRLTAGLGKIKASPSHSTAFSEYNTLIITAQKWSFPLRISSVNVTKSAGICGFGHIDWKNLNGKLHFLCSVYTFSVEVDIHFIYYFTLFFSWHLYLLSYDP